MLIIKGNIIYSKDKNNLVTVRNGYIGVKNNLIEFAGSQLPDEYKNYEVTDYGDMLIIPGFNDMHTHAPQYENIGIGMDEELLDWLNDYTFPTEARYKDTEYARRMYEKVVEKVIKSGTTRVVFFGTVHKDSCQVLIDVMREKGLRGYVGKVNMDAHCPESLIENSADSIKDSIEFYKNNMGNNDILPIITPRFAPSCTERTLKELGEIAKEYNAPVQSHINESEAEIEWVAQLFPDYENYADVYKKNNLLNDKTLMAHCIHMKDEEIELFSELGVWAIHCPQSNCNLSSGIMPLKKLMNSGVKIGFGTDVSGGNDISIIKTMQSAMQISRLRHAADNHNSILTLREAFYIATKLSGSYFGSVGSFEKGYEFDALVIDDKGISQKENLTLEKRLERFIFAGDDRNIFKRYIAGREVL